MLEGTNRQTGGLPSCELAKSPQELESKGGWFSWNQPYNSFARYLSGINRKVLPLTCGLYSNGCSERFGYLGFQQSVARDWPERISWHLLTTNAPFRSSLFSFAGSQTGILHKLVDYREPTLIRSVRSSNNRTAGSEIDSSSGGLT
jgi:hypothetical protein